MSNVNNTIFMQPIGPNDSIQNFNQMEARRSNSFDNNIFPRNNYNLNQNMHNYPQQYQFNQYHYNQQLPPAILPDHSFPHQDSQLINNPQTPHNYQQYTYPQQPYQPFLNSQSIHDDNNQQESEKKKYPEGINYYKKYRYDLYNIQYRHISINQWNDIPVDESPYSHMWETPESFEPEQFSKIHSNNEKNKKRNDLFWFIIFIVNVIASIAVFTYLTIKFRSNYDSEKLAFVDPYSKFQFEINEITNIKVYTKEIFIAVAIGAAIGLVFNIIHITYSTFAPLVYIKDSIWLCIIISILCIILLVIRGFYYAFGFPILTLILALLFFCCMRKDMSFSASVLTVVIKLFWNYPSVILILCFDTFFELIFGLSFSISIFFIEITETSRYLYIFICFSFLWVSSTFEYLTYMTIAGLTSSWYFLNDTMYYPKKPVWDAFKRNCKRSFGSASAAGFLLCFIKLLEFIANSDNICCNCSRAHNSYTTIPTTDINEERNEERPEKAILCLLKCIAISILKILEACIPFINQYALIYCAIFDVPFKEGCRRWAEMSCHKFCNLVLSGCCIKSAMFFNGLIWTIGSVSFGLGISNYIFKEFNNCDLPFPKISVSIFAFIFTYSIFQVFTQPFSTFADSLIICFFESPEKLKTSENNLYENMRSFYENSVEEMIQSSYQ